MLPSDGGSSTFRVPCSWRLVGGGLASLLAFVAVVDPQPAVAREASQVRTNFQLEHSPVPQTHGLEGPPVLSTFTRSPMDVAYGVDFEADPDQLARLKLSKPEVIEYLGVVEPPTERKLSGCDFQGNDFATLYCLDRENLRLDDTTNLVSIDTETGEITHLARFPLAGFGIEGLNGLTYDPTTGRMFAVGCYPFFGGTNSLYELDLEALTLNQIGESTDGFCTNAVGADNQGQLWALDLVDNGRLVAIDKNTATMTVVAPLDISFVFGTGMDFDASDSTCYIFVFNEDTFRGELRRCDTETGHTDLVGVMGQQLPGASLWGTGAIAAPSNCHVTLELGAEEVQAGDPLTIRIGVVHNRAETVTVPLALAIEDSSGDIVASRTAARTMKLGDHLDRALMLRVPKALPSGFYTVTLDVGEMEQGGVRLSKMFNVVASLGR